MEILNQYSGIIALVILICVGTYLLTRNNKQVEEEVVLKENTIKEKICYPLDENDEDATVACLIASIDARQETKKNMQVISVRRIG